MDNNKEWLMSREQVNYYYDLYEKGDINIINVNFDIKSGKTSDNILTRIKNYKRDGQRADRLTAYCNIFAKKYAEEGKTSIEYFEFLKSLKKYELDLVNIGILNKVVLFYTVYKIKELDNQGLSDEELENEQKHIQQLKEEYKSDNK